MTFICDPSDDRSSGAETLTRRESSSDERCRCEAEAFAERRLARRPLQADSPLLDPERQRAIREAIETEFP